jgi:hypothetical protein
MQSWGSGEAIDTGLVQRLIILRNVDSAHKHRKISANMRYEILQSLFPPVERNGSSGKDFCFYSADGRRIESGAMSVPQRDDVVTVRRQIPLQQVTLLSPS